MTQMNNQEPGQDNVEKAEAAVNGISPQKKADHSDQNQDVLIADLLTWLQEIPAQHPAEWEQLPDIGLYMDQVITYIERQLALQKTTEKQTVTSAMVNNYIKAGLLPRANQKKYNPNHLALLTMIGTLKPVLSIQELQILLENNQTDAEAAAMYSRFLTQQQAAVTDTTSSVISRLQELSDTAVENGDSMLSELQMLALNLAIDARVRILVAGQLLAAVEKANETARSEKAAASDKNRRKK